MKHHAPNSYSLHSHNKHEGFNKGSELYGGTALALDLNMRSHKAENSGNRTDTTRLGQWTWVQIKGKDNIHTQFISAYRPCASKRGISTVWAQHRTYFQDQGFPDPYLIRFFDNNLCNLLKEWLEIGDNIVLGIDMNKNTQTGSLAQHLQQMQLRDAVLSTHPTASVPATFSGCKTRKPINAIWVSPQVEVETAGYMPFDSPSPAAPSNGHCMLWVVLDNGGISGKRLPHSLKAYKGARLNSKHPHLRRKYNRIRKTKYGDHQVYEAEERLTNLSLPLPDESDNQRELRERQLQSTYLTLSRRICHCKVEATGNIRTIKMGKDNCSPKYGKHQKLIDLLRRVNQWKAGQKTSVWEMKKLAKKQGFTWQELMAKDQLQILKDLDEAYRKHYANKDKNPDWWTEHCISLKQAKADKEGVEVKVIGKQMKREARSKEEGEDSQ